MDGSRRWHLNPWETGKMRRPDWLQEWTRFIDWMADSQHTTQSPPSQLDSTTWRGTTHRRAQEARKTPDKTTAIAPT